jgi:hypothetical protein
MEFQQGGLIGGPGLQELVEMPGTLHSFDEEQSATDVRQEADDALPLWGKDFERFSHGLHLQKC